jgi:hypothetical protein
MASKREKSTGRFGSHTKFAAAIVGAFVYRNAVVIIALSLLMLVAWLRYFGASSN